MLINRNLISLMLMMVLPAAVLSGCSTANQDSPVSLVDASGNHPGGWITAHGVYAAPDGSLCMDCHGDDLAGGISGVSCSSDAVGCHSGGPAFHPADWLDKSATGNTWHAGAYQSGFQIGGLDCVDCHDPLGSSYPDDAGKCTTCHFTIAGARSPGGWTHPPPYDDNHGDFAGSPSVTAICLACHEVNYRFGNGPAGHGCESCHDVPYLDHNLAVPASGDFTARCSSCHTMDDPPVTSKQDCTFCHVAGSPYIQTNCTSCHGRPPNTGEHGEHSGEASCSECHLGAGSGSGLNHYYNDQVDVVFSASGFTYSSGRCTGTCHGEVHDNENWW